MKTRELKSTHQVKRLFDLLPPYDPPLPVGRKSTAGDISSFLLVLRCSSTRAVAPLYRWEWDLSQTENSKRKTENA